MNIYKALIMPSLKVIIILGPIIVEFWHCMCSLSMDTAQMKMPGRVVHSGNHSQYFQTLSCKMTTFVLDIKCIPSFFFAVVGLSLLNKNKWPLIKFQVSVSILE
jgi:hypothetical protein